MGRTYRVKVEGKYAQKGGKYVNLNVVSGGANPDGGLLRAERSVVEGVFGSVPEQFDITGWTNDNVVTKEHIKKK